MNAITKFFNDHLTKVLGSCTTIISGFIAIPDLISQPHLKYVAATNVVLGVLTVNRGFTNTRNLNAPVVKPPNE
jgi:hypothetical protein